MISWKDARLTRTTAALLAAAGVGSCWGDALDVSVNRIEQRALANARAPQFKMLAAEEKTQVGLTLGIARTHQPGGGGNTWTTPFQLDVAPAKTTWQFQVNGDGYTRVRAGGQTASGFADVGLLALHPITLGNSGAALIPGVGLTLPTGGDVGSRKLAEEVRLIGVLPFDQRWSGLAGGVLVHSEESRPGISQWTRIGLARVTYALAERSALKGTIKRGHTRGAGGVSFVDLEYDFPVGKVDTAVILTRGISSGPKATKLELNGTWNF